MSLFQYNIVLTNGDKRKGKLEALSAEAAEGKLVAQGCQVLSLKPIPEPMAIKMPGTTGISNKELIIFTRQLSTMIDAGLPIVQALELLASQEQNPHLKKVMLTVKSDVEGGMTFADALKKHPLVFDNLYTSLVSAGEIGGVLDTILARLCVQIEKNAQLAKKIKKALTYPIGTLVVAVIIMIFMLWKVIPTFQGMFDNMGGQLPSLTQFLVDASDWMSSNIVPILAIVIGVPLTIAICRKKIFAFHRAMDAFLLAMPGIGDVLRKSAVSRFTRTLATMMTSGVPLMDSLQIVENAAGNIRIAEGIEYARQRLSEGSTLADPLMVTGIFPNMVVAMIRVGEETGALDAMLGKIADSYDEEVDDAIDAMMAMLQPAIMALLGGMVGTMLIGMYLPIFSMGSMTGG